MDLGRFLARVEKSEGCWLWTGAKTSGGYGRIETSSGRVTAHRLSYRIYVGPIPDGMMVLHRCDVKACVNPEHLYVGTHTNNTQDAVDRKRMAHGERQHLSKLTDQKVREIRELRAQGLSMPAIALRYKVSTVSVFSVLAGDTWRHVV